MRIVVGSTNPVKINAAKTAIQLAFPALKEQVQIMGMAAPSLVSDQPMGDTETLRGARNRAIHCMKIHPDADLVIGIEGGCRLFEEDMECFAWAVVQKRNFKMDASGEATLMEGKARTASFTLPPAITKLIIEEGMELGEATDMIFNQHDSKRKGGSIGALTNDIVTRQKYYEHVLVLALVPFMNEEMYDNNP